MAHELGAGPLLLMIDARAGEMCADSERAPPARGSHNDDMPKCQPCQHLMSGFTSEMRLNNAAGGVEEQKLLSLGRAE